MTTIFKSFSGISTLEIFTHVPTATEIECYLKIGGQLLIIFVTIRSIYKPKRKKNEKAK